MALFKRKAVPAGPLHHWAKWEIATTGWEILERRSTWERSDKPEYREKAEYFSVPTQQRRCDRCGLYQVDIIGEESEAEYPNGRCDLQWLQPGYIGGGE